MFVLLKLGSYLTFLIPLPNYHPYRLDRNRHGGGILVYVRSSLIATLISTQPPPLQIGGRRLGRDSIFFASLAILATPFTLATFCRLPSLLHDLDLLLPALYFTSHSRIQNLILLGDFNVDNSSFLGTLFEKLNY